MPEPKTFDEVLEFARKEHARYLADLAEEKDPARGFPLPHIYLFRHDRKMDALALMISKEPNLAEFLTNLRLMVQAKILFEGIVASVFCGVVLSSPTLPPDLQRIMMQKEKTDPNFLETMEKEYGVVNRENVVVTAECFEHTFLRSQRYYVQGKKLFFDGEPREEFNRPLPRLPHCNFTWDPPAVKHRGAGT